MSFYIYVKSLRDPSRSGARSTLRIILRVDDRWQRGHSRVPLAGFDWSPFLTETACVDKGGEDFLKLTGALM
jgi:hypothetical protein